MRHRTTAALLCSSLILIGGMAFAQTTSQPATPVDQPQPALTGAEDSNALQLRLQKVESELDALKKEMNEPKGPVQSAISDVKKMSKISFSGYAQMRYTQDQSSTLTKNSNTFDVRRARLKMVAHPSDNAAVVYEADFGGVVNSSGGGNVSTRNAYIDYYLKGNPATGWTVTAGQMLWPFGYQNLLSSSVRETPEYALPINSLLPGQYDRGVKVTSPTGKKLYVETGVYNGIQTGGTTAANKVDDNYFKDVVGRARYKVGPQLDAGISWYIGKSELSTGSPIRVSRDLYGADVEYRMKTSTLKAEYIGGVADGYDKSGYWAQVTHDFSPKDMGVVMFDSFSDKSNIAHGNLSDLNIGYIRALDKSTKFKLFYVFRNEEKSSIKNNQLIAEVLTLF